LVIIVNFDNYKLRILFNYLNLHGNSNGVTFHIFMNISFAFLIYMLIVNINYPIPNINQEYISESDKIKLSYRLDILTIIIFIFSTSMIFLL
jgi:hypothetical protein